MRRNAVEQGFTLMELLGVTAIVVVLAAILLPVISASREGARQTICLSNVRQLTSAFVLYIQDYDETLPGAGIATSAAIDGNWVPAAYISPELPCAVESGVLFPYVHSAPVYICPSDPFGTQRRLSYGMNDELSFVSTAQVTDSSSTVLLVDAQAELDDGGINAVHVVPILSVNPPVNVPVLGPDYPTTAHNGGGNLGYLDGHAKWARGTAVPAEEYLPNPSSPPTFGGKNH